MICMKCGKEVSDSNVFCDECLTDMERYPVKPGTPVLLPNRPKEVVIRKRNTRRAKKPEDQISTLKNWITFLCIFSCLLMAALTLSILLNLRLLGNQDIDILPEQHFRAAATVASTKSNHIG